MSSTLSLHLGKFLIESLHKPNCHGLQKFLSLKAVQSLIFPKIFSCVNFIKSFEPSQECKKCLLSKNSINN